MWYALMSTDTTFFLSQICFVVVVRCYIFYVYHHTIVSIIYIVDYIVYILNIIILKYIIRGREEL